MPLTPGRVGPGRADLRPRPDTQVGFGAVLSASSMDVRRCRIICQPCGGVVRRAWRSHRSYVCGSWLPASGPSTAIESAYENVRVATASSLQEIREHGLTDMVLEGYRRCPGSRLRACLVHAAQPCRQPRPAAGVATGTAVASGVLPLARSSLR